MDTLLVGSVKLIGFSRIKSWVEESGRSQLERWEPFALFDDEDAHTRTSMRILAETSECGMDVMAYEYLRKKK